MAKWSEPQQRWIFSKVAENDNQRVPMRSFSGLMYLDPNMKWVITYKDGGSLEFYEEWAGIAEYDTQLDAASVLKDIKGEYPHATDWKVIRHPMIYNYVLGPSLS
jgi:hypothetical protein